MDHTDLGLGLEFKVIHVVDQYELREHPNRINSNWSNSLDLGTSHFLVLILII